MGVRARLFIGPRSPNGGLERRSSRRDGAGDALPSVSLGGLGGTAFRSGELERRPGLNGGNGAQHFCSGRVPSWWNWCGPMGPVQPGRTRHGSEGRRVGLRMHRIGGSRPCSSLQKRTEN